MRHCDVELAGLGDEAELAGVEGEEEEPCQRVHLVMVSDLKTGPHW
jgi:hypothetical protein